MIVYAVHYLAPYYDPMVELKLFGSIVSWRCSTLSQTQGITYIYTLYVGAYLDFLYGSQNSYKDMYMFVYAHIM